MRRKGLDSQGERDQPKQRPAADASSVLGFIIGNTHLFGLSPVPSTGLLKPLEFFLRRVINVYFVRLTRSLLDSTPGRGLVSYEADRVITGLELVVRPLQGGQRGEDGAYSSTTQDSIAHAFVTKAP